MTDDDANPEAASSDLAAKRGITLDHLKQLVHIFDDQEELEVDEFIEAARPILGGLLTDAQLADWFVRIDANANGSLDWDELSTFLVLLSADEDVSEKRVGTYQRDENKKRSAPAAKGSANATSGINHSEAVSKLILHKKANRCFTSSPDGTVRMWNAQTLEFESVIHHTKYWISDMCLMRNDTRLVVPTLDRVVSIYDVYSGKFSRAFVGLKHGTSRVKIQYNRQISKLEMGLITTGRLTARPRFDDESLEDYKERSDAMRAVQVPVPPVDAVVLSHMQDPATAVTAFDDNTLLLGLANGQVQRYNLYSAPSSQSVINPDIDMRVHREGITGIRCSRANIDGAMSVSCDGTVALTNFEKGIVTYKQTKPSMGAMYCCDWSEENKALATCGMSKKVYIWSLKKLTPTFVLEGHMTSVVSCAFDDQSNSLVTVGSDKVFKVWDIRTYKCVNTFTDDDNYTPKNMLTSVAVDSSRGAIYAACTAPVTYTRPGNAQLRKYPSGYDGHQRQVAAVDYNQHFNQLVTADTNVVKVWDVFNGQLSASSIVEVPSQATDDATQNIIVAVKLDSNGRKLLVAMTNGCVKVFNYANFQLMVELVPTAPLMGKLPSRIEVSDMICTIFPDQRRFVYAAVMNAVIVWLEEQTGTNKKGPAYVVSAELTEAQAQRLVRGQKHVTRSHSVTSLCMAFPYLCVGTSSGVVLLYSALGDYTLLTVLGEAEPLVAVESMCYNELSVLLFTARSDSTIHIYSLVSKDMVWQLDCHIPRTSFRSLTTVVVDEESRSLVTVNDDAIVFVFRLNVEVLLSHVSEDQRNTGEVPTSTFFPKSTDDPCIFRSHFKAHERFGVSGVTFVNTPSGQFIATAARDTQVRLFTMGGKFVGYCGCKSGWKLAVAQDDSLHAPTTPFPVEHPAGPIQPEVSLSISDNTAPPITPLAVSKQRKALMEQILYDNDNSPNPSLQSEIPNASIASVATRGSRFSGYAECARDAAHAESPGCLPLEPRKPSPRNLGRRRSSRNRKKSRAYTAEEKGILAKQAGILSRVDNVGVNGEGPTDSRLKAYLANNSQKISTPTSARAVWPREKRGQSGASRGMKPKLQRAKKAPQFQYEELAESTLPEAAPVGFEAGGGSSQNNSLSLPAIPHVPKRMSHVPPVIGTDREGGFPTMGEVFLPRIEVHTIDADEEQPSIPKLDLRNQTARMHRRSISIPRLSTVEQRVDQESEEQEAMRAKTERRSMPTEYRIEEWKASRTSRLVNAHHDMTLRATTELHVHKPSINLTSCLARKKQLENRVKPAKELV